MTNTSSKTTVAGIAAAVALIAKAVADATADGFQWDDVTLIVGALMLALQGYWSRDRDVTSEGRRTTVA